MQHWRQWLISAWSVKWLPIYRKRARPRSYATDESLVRRWIVPTLGSIPIEMLTPDDVRATFPRAMYYRSRYTALDVAWELGIFDDLVAVCREHPVVTLVFGARDTEHNEAVVLAQVLEERLR